MSSARRTGATTGGGGVAGMEKPTTEEVGSEDLGVEPASPGVGRSRDAHDFLRVGGADTGVNVDVDAGAGSTEEETASIGARSVVSSDDGGGSGTSMGVISWVTIEGTIPATRSHDSEMDFI